MITVSCSFAGMNAIDALRYPGGRKKKGCLGCNRSWLIFGWFRTEDYLKAVELLAREAAERWERADKENPETKYELNLYIEGNHLPLSEYNALFADGEWG